MDAYQDPNHPGNGPGYHTGKKCIEGCGRPAGTAWSPLWCFECNVKRMDRITNSFRQFGWSYGRGSEEQRRGAK